MNSGRARDIFEKYATAMAYVSVQTADGRQDIGSAFHVGDGVFVTARHVVEGNQILEIASTEQTYIRLEGSETIGMTTVHRGDEIFQAHTVNNGVMKLSCGPFLHHDPTIDVAVFQVEGIDARTPYAPLGGHFDDWLGESDFVLWEAIILGYPPIPYTTRPHLVGARAEVNAQIDVRDSRHVHFVLSSMPRGGFSGGLAILEARNSEFVLGLITRTLLMNSDVTELGFFTVLSVEPIHECLEEHDLLPEFQRIS